MTKAKTTAYECDTRWGIINPFGGVWTPETFPTEKDAWDHLRRFWEPNAKDLDTFSVEQVRITVERKQRVPEHLTA